MSFPGAGGADFTVAGAINVGVNTTGLQGFSRGLQDMAQQAAATGRSVAKSLSDIGQRTRSIGQGLTVGVTTPLVGLAVGAVKAGSDLNESMSAVETVFGDAAQSVIDFSKTSATALGQSQNATLGAASALGALFKGVGFSEKQMADFSKSTLQAASDLGSFYNVDPGTALQDIQSGLVGQSEPLRKYGILLSETAVQQKAMAQTGKTNASELTEQEKVAARYALIMEQLGAAQGDFARTSGGLANRQRILRAQLADTAAQLGTQLLPITLRIVTGIQHLITTFQGFSARTQRFVLIGAGIAAALGPVLIVVGSIASGIAALIPVFGAVATAVGLLLSPIGLIVAGLVLLGLAYKTNVLGFGDAVRSVAFAIVGAVGPILAAFVALGRYIRVVVSDGDVLNDWLTHLPAPIRGIVVQVGRVINAFRKMGEAVGEIIAGFRSGGLKGGLEALFGHAGRKLLEGFGDAISAPAKAIGSLLRNIHTGFAPLDSLIHRVGAVFVDFGRLIQEIFQGDFRGALAVGERLLGHLLDVAVAAFRLIPPTIVAVFRAIDWGQVGTFILQGFQLAVNLLADAGQWLLGPGRKLLGGLIAGAVEKLPDLLSFLGGLADEALDAIGDAAKWLYDKGIDLLHGLWQGAVDGAAKLWDFITSIPTLFAQLFRNAGTWLYNVGLNIIQGMWNGIADKWHDMTRWINDAAGKLPGFVKGPLGISSPSRVLYGVGEHAAQGLFNGLADVWRRRAGDLAGLAQGLAGTVQQGLRGVFSVGDAMFGRQKGPWGGAILNGWEKLTDGFWRAVNSGMIVKGIRAEDGSFVNPSFYYGTGYTAGTALGQGTADGFRRALGIASPSKVLMRLGQQAADGFRIGYVGGLRAIHPPTLPPTPALDVAASRGGVGRTVIIQGGVHAHVNGANLNARQIAEQTAAIVMRAVNRGEAQYAGGVG